MLPHLRRSPIPWHILCIPLMATGCIWVRGGWTVRQNSPPAELLVEPRDELLLDNEEKSVMVRFRDDDNERVFFSWFVDDNRANEADVTDSSQVMNDVTVYESVLKVRRTSPAPLEIRCIATDGTAVTQVSWTVVTP